MKIKENVISKLDQSRYGIKRLKFNELYDSIEECISELKEMPDNIINNKLKGYEYLLSFKKAILDGRTLSDKQITQLKRLAPEVARGYYIYTVEKSKMGY